MIAMQTEDLYRQIDELVAEYVASAEHQENPRQRAIRSPRAAWCAVYTHAEHRIHQHPRKENDSAN